MPLLARVTAIALTLAVGAPVFSSALAQDLSSLPSTIRASVEREMNRCAPEKAELKEGFITRKDINGDGTADYVLNYEAFGCTSKAERYCSPTGGCKHEAFVVRPGGKVVLVLDETVLRAEFSTIKGRPAMTLSIKGIVCGSETATCTNTLFWNGKQFQPGR